MKNSIRCYFFTTLCCILFLISGTLNAQKRKTDKNQLYIVNENNIVYVIKHDEIDLSLIDENKIRVFVDKRPRFGASPEQVREFFKNNLRYPKIEREDTLKSRIVRLQYCVTKEGEIENISVIKGLTPQLDAEAVRFFKTIPSMKPGMKNGMPVSTVLTYDLVFDSIKSPLIGLSKKAVFMGKSGDEINEALRIYINKKNGLSC